MQLCSLLQRSRDSRKQKVRWPAPITAASIHSYVSCCANTWCGAHRALAAAHRRTLFTKQHDVASGGAIVKQPADVSYGTMHFFHFFRFFSTSSFTSLVVQRLLFVCLFGCNPHVAFLISSLYSSLALLLSNYVLRFRAFLRHFSSFLFWSIYSLHWSWTVTLHFMRSFVLRIALFA